MASIGANSNPLPPLRGAGPWYVEVPAAEEPETLFRRLVGAAGLIWFDSADTESPFGAASFLAWEPFETLTVPVDAPDPLPQLGRRLAEFRSATLPELPGFQGGCAGLWSFDLARSLERVPAPAHRDLELPALQVGLYDRVVGWEHRTGRCWIVAHGFPERTIEARRERAEREIAEAWELLHHRSASAREDEASPYPSRHEGGDGTLVDLACRHEVPKCAGVLSNFPRDGFLEAVARGIEAIRNGDIFQVNLAHRLALPARHSAAELYLRMRRLNPAPFAAYFDGGSAEIVSASPERLFAVRDGRVESRPIKGTTLRSHMPEVDLPAAGILRSSAKDRAENLMIVDLLRNDLSRVCDVDSIRVTQLCGIERYRTVQHLVSAIEGRLSAGCELVDVVAALFPGGSITGAPKIRAMELIAEIEPTPRAAYCGSIGYLGFDGSADLNILIRTVTDAGGWWTFPVGGGIVVQSDPRKELDETWQKARGMLQAVLA